LIADGEIRDSGTEKGGKAEKTRNVKRRDEDTPNLFPKSDEKSRVREKKGGGNGRQTWRGE